MISFNDLFTSLHFSATAADLIAISLTVVLGLTVGRITFGKISIGVAGVLFSGIFLSQLGLTLHPEILDFSREFGLILFVYTIGVQVGPRFFDNLKQNGLKLNILAAVIVLLGVVLAFIAYHLGKLGLGPSVGVLSGAVTNTPSLGAAQQILAQQKSDAVNLSTIAYAIAYPMGICGIIISMLLLKFFKKIDIAAEQQAYAQQNSGHVIAMNIAITNKNVAGLELGKIPDIDNNQVVISRVMHDGQITLPHHNTVLHMGDVIRAVGPKKEIDELLLCLGAPSTVHLEQIPGDLTGRRMVITNQKAVGKTIHSLNLRQSFRVTATRIGRDDHELPAGNHTILYYGDSIYVVGEPSDLEKFAKFIGDSAHGLNHPFVLPIFVGMLLGILVGQIPIHIPGLPSPVKIGLAGGPLIVAILASRLGRFGHVVWYMPTSANLLMRKFGISLFLACVGLKSGAHFIQTVLTMQGLMWFLWGTAITVIPLVIVGAFALWRMKINYLTVCGLLAGSLTDPPALSFANALANGNAQAVAYSTVYPLVMIMRIISIQILVILLSAGGG